VFYDMRLFMICVAPIHLAVYTNGDCACFTIIVIKFTSLTYTTKRIGESTADDSHFWIFAQIVYD